MMNTDKEQAFYNLLIAVKEKLKDQLPKTDQQQVSEEQSEINIAYQQKLLCDAILGKHWIN
jgi:hypothetical protein